MPLRKVVTMRLTEPEGELVDRAAAQQGLDRAAFMRQAVLAAAEVATDPTVQLPHRPIEPPGIGEGTVLAADYRDALAHVEGHQPTAAERLAAPPMLAPAAPVVPRAGRRRVDGPVCRVCGGLATPLGHGQAQCRNTKGCGWKGPVA